jgi:MoaA/NifB/PqqE/SkfB family radical SAM enzyme
MPLTPPAAIPARPMTTARVRTNETCNQNCGFCNARTARDVPQWVQRSAVLARIDAALATGAAELVLTGGEPGLRRDLALLVRHGHERGVRVVLETNAVLFTPERARELRLAGLDLARVHLPAWGSACDAITQDPDGFVATLTGMRALADAGVALEVSVPVVRANLQAVATIPAELRASGLPVQELVVVVPNQAPHPHTLADLASAATAIAALERAADAVHLPIRLDPSTLIPPCLFERPGRVAHLYSLHVGRAKRAGFQQVSACQECRVVDRCPGLPQAALDRGEVPNLRPITEDRLRRRLSQIANVAQQIERELVTRETCRRADGTTVPMHTVRVQFRCNQACHFCFVSTHLPAAEDARVREAIRDAGRAGGILALSGGEPTLHPQLHEYARLGKDSGACEVELQTNATRLADPELSVRLVQAGVDVAFVSLHGSCPEVSDAVTDAPGTFLKTVAGIDGALLAGMRVRLNFVFCQLNFHDFVPFVALVAARWPGTALAVSFVAASTDQVPHTRALIPRYTDVLPHMARGISLALASGLQITGFESMCGLPLCLVPQDMQPWLDLAPVPDHAGEFIQPAPCQSCHARDRCYGLRRGYFALYGDEELRPLGARAES